MSTPRPDLPVRGALGCRRCRVSTCWSRPGRIRRDRRRVRLRQVDSTVGTVGSSVPTAGRVRVGPWDLMSMSAKQRVAYRSRWWASSWQQTARSIVQPFTAAGDVEFPLAARRCRRYDARATGHARRARCGVLRRSASVADVEAASSSASRSPWRSRTARRSCSRTSPPARTDATSFVARRSWKGYGRSTASWARRSSSMLRRERERACSRPSRSVTVGPNSRSSAGRTRPTTLAPRPRRRRGVRGARRRPRAGSREYREALDLVGKVRLALESSRQRVAPMAARGPAEYRLPGVTGPSPSRGTASDDHHDRALQGGTRANGRSPSMRVERRATAQAARRCTPSRTCRSRSRRELIALVGHLPGRARRRCSTSSAASTSPTQVASWSTTGRYRRSTKRAGSSRPPRRRVVHQYFKTFELIARATCRPRETSASPAGCAGCRPRTRRRASSTARPRRTRRARAAAARRGCRGGQRQLMSRSPGRSRTRPPPARRLVDRQSSSAWGRTAVIALLRAVVEDGGHDGDRLDARPAHDVAGRPGAADRGRPPGRGWARPASPPERTTAPDQHGQGPMAIEVYPAGHVHA